MKKDDWKIQEYYTDEDGLFVIIYHKNHRTPFYYWKKDKQLYPLKRAKSICFDCEESIPSWIIKKANFLGELSRL